MEQSAMPISPPAIAVEGLSRRYGGLWALQGVTFDVRAHTVTSLIGPNGSGKTTLFNIVAGLTSPSAGSVRVCGKDVTGWPPHRIARLGTARTFQDIRLFAHLTVLENVMVATYMHTHSGIIDALLHLPRQRRESRETKERAESLLRAVGLQERLSDNPRELSYGNQRRLEIARALAAEPSVLMLDEPTSGVRSREAHDIVDLVADIVAEGRTAFLIEHNMDTVSAISDVVIVLNFGRKIAEGAPADVLTASHVVDAYLGTSTVGVS